MSLFRILVCCILLSLANPPCARANHAAGGEIYYEWLSDSTYRVFVKLYRDCTGDAEPSTMPLCLRNTCNNSVYSYTMTKFAPTGVPSSLFCPKYKTKCDSLQSTFSGNITWTYAAIVTLPARCSSWKFFSYTSHRSASANLTNSTSSSFYIEATLNNQVAQGNSSPYFLVPQLNYVYVNKPFSYNNQSLDPNGDSLVTEVVNPLTGVATCSDVATNATVFSGFSLTTNPFSTGNSFAINANTGQFNFTAAAVGNHTLAMRVKEYRNGILIGSVMRETSIQAFPQFPAGLTWMSSYKDSFSNCYDNLSRIHGCVNYPMHFTLHVVGSTDTAIWKLSDNILAAVPGATITYAGQGTDSVSASFSWTPTLSDAGLHSFIYIVKDSSCTPLGPLFYTITQSIYIYPPMKAMPDTGVCPGGSVVLWGIADLAYIWNILPGGSPNSLSCTNCQNPIATPTVTTQYEVSGMVCSFRDTVTIYTWPATYPAISVAASPDTNILTGTNVSFTATATCNHPSYQWMLNGNPVAGATSATWSSSALVDMDKVSCKLGCGDTCATPKDTLSNKLTMHVSLSVDNLSGGNRQLAIYPNPNNGHFTIKLNGITSVSKAEIMDMTGRFIYAQYLKANTDHIDLNNAPDGLYLLRIKTAGGVTTKLFSVQR
jgi:hypothetical protein